MYGNVLIVEDEGALRLVMAANLRRRGHRVREAATAREAIEALLEERPDLLLLDINLPDRSGWDVAREMRAGGTSWNGELATRAGVSELRAACLTLASSPAGLMTATSMVAPLTGRPGEVRILRALSEELAELHGLAVAFRADGSSFTVRFSRRPPVATSAPRRGVVATILAALGSPWKKGR